MGTIENHLQVSLIIEFLTLMEIIKGKGKTMNISSLHSIIINKLNDLIYGILRREDISEWAVQIATEVDKNNINIDNETYWDTITSMIMADSITNEGYLYHELDFQNWLNAINQNNISKVNNDLKTAKAIGDNWVLCPECHEAFEVNPVDKVVQCLNVACETYLNNPYYKNPNDHPHI